MDGGADPVRSVLSAGGHLQLGHYYGGMCQMRPMRVLGLAGRRIARVCANGITNFVVTDGEWGWMWRRGCVLQFLDAQMASVTCGERTLRPRRSAW